MTRYPLRQYLRRLLPASALILCATGAGSLRADEFRNGDVFAAMQDGDIAHLSGQARVRELLDTGARGPLTGMCFDAEGNLYATNFAASTMSKFDQQGRLLVRSWGGPFGGHPESCVVDAAGHVYTSEVGGRNQIRKFDSGGRLLDSYSPRIENKGVDWIDLAADQCTMFYTSEGSTVRRFDVCRKSQLGDFAQGLGGPCFAMRVRENGEVMVACAKRVYRLTSSGSVVQTYPYSGSSDLFAMNLDPDGIHFWTGPISGQIFKVRIDNGSGLDRPLADVAKPRNGGPDLLRELGRLLGGAPGGAHSLFGLAVYGERTAALAETLRRAEEKERRGQEARRAEEERQRQQAARRAEEERQRQQAARLAEEERQRQEAARLAEEERQRQETLRRAEEERQRQEAARLAEEERRRQEALRRAEQERQRLEAERLAEEERQRLEALRQAEEERQRLEAERRAEEERQRREAARLAEEERRRREEEERRRREEEERRRREEEERRKRQGVVHFGPERAVDFGPVDPSSASESSLDLSGTRVEGGGVANLTTDLDAPGIVVEIRVGDDWQALGPEPLSLEIPETGARQWPLRLRAGRCPTALPAGGSHAIHLEAKGPEQTTARLQVPLALVVRESTWLQCWWPALASLLGIALGGVVIHGCFSPSRFPSRLGVQLSPEEDMHEGFFYPIRARRGFYRDARVYVTHDHRLRRKAAGALVRLRADGQVARIKPASGATVWRQTADGEWERLGAGESAARVGHIFRDDLESVFFELRNG